MRREVIQTDKTVEAAIDAACLQLGCEREDCEWEIIDLPKKGLFGFKNTLAKVRVSIEVPGEEPSIPKPAAKAAAPEKRVRREEPEREPAGGEKKPLPVKREISAEYADKVEIVSAYLTGILREMGLTASLSAAQEAGGVNINLAGEGLGVIIGRRGETLDALQYLSGLVANRSAGEYLRVTLDCGDYRLRRKETLEALAAKLASQVLKTNVSKTLEPMNPFERRIIHAAVSEIEGVSSTSIGEEPNRRVVITSPTARSGRPFRFAGGGNRSSSGGQRDARSDGRNHSRWDAKLEKEGRAHRGRGGDRRGPRPQSMAPQESPKQTPEAAVDTNSLYTKIDLE